MYSESWEDYYDFSTSPPTPRNRKEITLGPECLLTVDRAVQGAVRTLKVVQKKQMKRKENEKF